ncbi:hypothetical protein NA57DRAFT_52883 [Rhizodiscina lignyota]|uniref:(4-O-methyl)-D-glucuronate--lignin esterase n=1 Tax=Rhizodiscina lignyota TaxID=1504668 RepID=A0A9P4MFA1_9PEZI|nr:hypothetical protein NA57DRAFT_52883 [Rhizodiscina lignyota]
MRLASFIPFVLSFTSTLAQDYGYGAGYGREFGEVPDECARLPSHIKLVNQTYILPDPFYFLSGAPVSSKASWTCRAAQLRSLFQKYELGLKPTRPPVLKSSTSKVSSNTTGLTITAGWQSNTIDWTVNITYPSSGKKPYPALIAYGGLSVPAPDGAAIIVFDNSEMGQQDNTSSRGLGLYYDLYGHNASASSMMAWAWAVSRIIDVLEASPDLNINTKKLGITGCSRDGKGVLVAGAFDERIILTIPQESGSGGDACWRTSRDMLVNRGLATQAAVEIVTENVWFSLSFDQFAATNYSIGLLPVDHHELAGLVAPRGLYSTENVGFLWLGDWSNYECMKTANKIFQSLGVGNHQGFSQDGPHDHCMFPSDQVSEITAFYDKFLFDEQADTSVFRTVGNWTYDPRWAPWRVPKLY